MKRAFYDLLDSIYEHYLAWGILFALAAIGADVYFYYLNSPLFFYEDTDCYTRALRIVDWLSDFQWNEKIFPYTNAPNGFVLHFTRINDYIWALFSLPFMPFMPLKEAVYNGGLFFSPLFFILTFLPIQWGLYPFLLPVENKKTVYFLTMIFILLLLCKMSSVFDFTRPDHHSLMCAIFAFNIAAVLRCCYKMNYKIMLWSGVVSGVGLWASSAIEGGIISAINLCVLSVNWLWGKWNIKALAYYSMGLFAATLFAWLINPPFGGWFVLDLNRLCVIHVVLTALIFISFTAISLGRFNSWKKRTVALFITALTSALIMVIVFGTKTLFTSIYDTNIQQYFLPRITEMYNILKFEYAQPIVAFGLACIILLLSFSGKPKVFAVDLSIFTLFSTVICCFVIRFYPYYVVLFCFLSTLFVYMALYDGMKKKIYKLVAFAYMIGNLTLMASYSSYPGRPDYPDFKHGVLLTDVFLTPYLVYTYDIDTVGSPYHTNIEGIIDNHIMWFTNDEEKLKELLKKHGVTQIYLDNHGINEYYMKYKAEEDNLYGRVMKQKELYDWLKEGDNEIYSVNYDRF